MSEPLAIYTTIYPGCEPYLRDWYRSLLRQTDQTFELWVGLDQLSVDQVWAACDAEFNARWISMPGTPTPADVRQQALAQLSEHYAMVVLVDSDDVLLPTRVAAARAGLHQHDVYGCALEVIAQDGQREGIVFGPPPELSPTAILPRYNVWGLSNTAYCTAMLRRCLPIPSECILIDWLLATRAWALNARMLFDPTPHMEYRQYAANLARIRPPFSAAQVSAATVRVLSHYDCCLHSAWRLPEPIQHQLELAHQRARQFATACTAPATLQRYVQALNQLEPEPIWWWCVAHPDLEELWNR